MWNRVRILGSIVSTYFMVLVRVRVIMGRDVILVCVQCRPNARQGVEKTGTWFVHLKVFCLIKPHIVKVKHLLQKYIAYAKTTTLTLILTYEGFNTLIVVREPNPSP